jgi:putative NADH-flavin reductase
MVTGSSPGAGLSPEVNKRPLKLLVIGATRGTGLQVMRQALAAGHTVTALARDPARIELHHERLSVLRGDVLDPASLAPSMAGQDAVLSSLGATSGRGQITLYSEGMRNIIQAMRAAGVPRLIAVSAGPLSIDEGDTLPSRLLMKPLLRVAFREAYADLARMEEEMRESGLDWTIMRPPRLTDKPPTGRYRTAVNRSVRRGYSIARADLAGAILKLLDDPTAIHATMGIGY